MRLSSPTLSHLMAAALLALSSLPASAALITYTFTGATEGSSQLVYNYVEIDGNRTEAPSNGSCSNCLTGGISFTIDTSRYIDTATDIKSAVGDSSQLNSWLSATSTFSGGVSDTGLVTLGNLVPLFQAQENDDGSGGLLAQDLAVLDRFAEYDSLDRLVRTGVATAYHRIDAYSSSIDFSIVDGQELLSAMSNPTGTFQLFMQSVIDYYEYDELGNTNFRREYSEQRAYMPIASLRITGFDIPVNGVPEPGSLALLGLGGALLAWRSRRRT